ncbi:hypothetical protein FYK55_17590 [Roseiconus nitratireducens]|uniref:Uncharacterized protein n=1 Tax=Roseiconus nitratireducens TaxID=2605748 RepID=A0A5M6D1M5_9BACT|nr:hypothetical protein [Roseiconus nitratireducens]KAA5541384.1 hypothetical protein FYK55_17590 [Roseiconus nitratireducens]
MRLPVILVQNPPAGGASVAEALVGDLIGRSGLDLTLVGRFDAIAAGSTDRLTLDSITGPAAVLDWSPVEEMVTALHRIGFEGVRAPHLLDADASAPSRGRRLFCFDLRNVNDARTVIGELARLRESLSVKTVSLGGLSTPDSRAAASVGTSPQNPASTQPIDPPKDSRTQRRPSFQSTSDESLDALIDQLDDLDV